MKNLYSVLSVIVACALIVVAVVFANKIGDELDPILGTSDSSSGSGTAKPPAGTSDGPSTIQPPADTSDGSGTTQPSTDTSVSVDKFTSLELITPDTGETPSQLLVCPNMSSYVSCAGHFGEVGMDEFSYIVIDGIAYIGVSRYISLSDEVLSVNYSFSPAISLLTDVEFFDSFSSGDNTYNYVYYNNDFSNNPGLGYQTSTSTANVQPYENSFHIRTSSKGAESLMLFFMFKVDYESSEQMIEVLGELKQHVNYLWIVDF